MNAFMSVPCSPTAVYVCARLRGDLLRFRRSRYRLAYTFGMLCFRYRTRLSLCVHRITYSFGHPSKSHSRASTVVPPSLA